jgi:hypothetical protein
LHELIHAGLYGNDAIRLSILRDEGYRITSYLLDAMRERFPRLGQG